MFYYICVVLVILIIVIIINHSFIHSFTECANVWVLNLLSRRIYVFPFSIIFISYLWISMIEIEYEMRNRNEWECDTYGVCIIIIIFIIKLLSTINRYENSIVWVSMLWLWLLPPVYIIFRNYMNLLLALTNGYSMYTYGKYIRIDIVSFGHCFSKYVIKKIYLFAFIFHIIFKNRLSEEFNAKTMNIWMNEI